jgi:hypothetical protein
MQALGVTSALERKFKMTTERLPGKEANGMQFSSMAADALWGRSKTDPQWRAEGEQLVNGAGNKLKLVDGKWTSA